MIALHCPDCGRYLGEFNEVLETVRCPCGGELPVELQAHLLGGEC